MARNIRWATDWIVKAHYEQSAQSADGNALVVQVGDATVDHSMWWGRPEDQPSGGPPSDLSWRPVWTVNSASKAGADQVGSAAAALASASLVFRIPGFSQVSSSWDCEGERGGHARRGVARWPTHTRASVGAEPPCAQDNDYADLLISRAKMLYMLAKVLPGSFKPPTGERVYGSSSWRDDLAHAAAWLCLNDTSYCQEAHRWWNEDRLSRRDLFSPFGYGYDNPGPQTSLLLLKSGWLESRAFYNHTDYLAQRLDRWLDGSRSCPAQEYTVCYTPGGLAWFTSWGALRHAANAAFLALAYNKLRPTLQEYPAGGGSPRDAT